MKQKGATLIEIVIGMAVTCIAIVAIIYFVVGRVSDEKKAKKAAQEYASKLENATGEVLCTSRDTDGDGYCSCSIFLKGGGTKDLECGCNMFASGCKPAKLMKMINKNIKFGE